MSDAWWCFYWLWWWWLRIWWAKVLFGSAIYIYSQSHTQYISVQDPAYAPHYLMRAVGFSRNTDFARCLFTQWLEDKIRLVGLSYSEEIKKKRLLGLFTSIKRQSWPSFYFYIWLYLWDANREVEKDAAQRQILRGSHQVKVLWFLTWASSLRYLNSIIKSLTGGVASESHN